MPYEWRTYRPPREPINWRPLIVFLILVGSIGLVMLVSHWWGDWKISTLYAIGLIALLAGFLLAELYIPPLPSDPITLWWFLRWIATLALTVFGLPNLFRYTPEINLWEFVAGIVYGVNFFVGFGLRRSRLSKPWQR